jgi:hypothetical protein
LKQNRATISVPCGRESAVCKAKHPTASVDQPDPARLERAESFHLLRYLRDQGIPRDRFEVIVIGAWVLLGMPEECYYHKHLMYNIGIVLVTF